MPLPLTKSNVLDTMPLAPGHADLHNQLARGLNGVEDVVGVAGSTDPDSHEYRISATETLLGMPPNSSDTLFGLLSTISDKIDGLSPGGGGEPASDALLARDLFPDATYSSVATAAWSSVHLVGGAGSVKIANAATNQTATLQADGAAVPFAIAAGQTIRFDAALLTSGPAEVRGA